MLPPGDSDFSSLRVYLGVSFFFSDHANRDAKEVAGFLK